MQKLPLLDIEHLPSKPSEIKYQYRRTPMSPIVERELSHIPQLKTSLDDMLNKIRFGRYQLICYLTLGLILINDGAEIITLSFLVPILEKDPKWRLSALQIEVLASSVFIAALITSFFSGKLSDRFGRRIPLIVIVFLTYIFAMLQATVADYPELLMVRIIYGGLVGLQFPMSFSYLAEITPPYARGKMMVLASGFYAIGGILACLFALRCLDNISAGNWRALFLWIAQPAIICFFLLIYCIKESPRHLFLVKRNTEEGIAILEHIARSNGYRSPYADASEEQGDSKSSPFSERQINGLVLWAQNQDGLFAKEAIGSLKTLWVGDYKEISINIWIIWFVVAVVYQGMAYYLPLLLTTVENVLVISTDKKQIYEALIIICAEIPSVAIAFLFVDRSRRNSIMTSFLICGVACLIVFFNEFGMVLVIAISRVAINVCFAIAIPYTTEIYPTSIRATGMGFAGACSRFGGVIMPWITISLFNINPLAPFIAYSALCLLAAYCCKHISYDTAGVDLDFHEINKEYYEMNSFPPNDSLYKA